MKANTCLLLLVIGWFIAGLPIALVVLINSIIKLKDNVDVMKYTISIAISFIYIILFINYL